MYSTWSLSEKEYIRRHSATMKDTDMAERLTQLTGRKISVQSLRKQRRLLGIIKRCGRGICEIRGTDAVNKAKSCVQPKQPPLEETDNQ